MSTYGESPQDPSGQQPPPNPYGGQPPNPYGGQPPNPYGGASAYGAAPAAYGGARPPYSFWGKRVGATIVDLLCAMLAALPAYIGIAIIGSTAEAGTLVTNADGTVSTVGGDPGSPLGWVLIGLGFLTSLGFGIWNQFIKQGRTGYTIGKGVLGIKLVSEASGAPIGAGMAFVRWICHFVDGLCYIGYLWPLWDAKRQTFADKILSTVVLDIPKP